MQKKTKPCVENAPYKFGQIKWMAKNLGFTEITKPIRKRMNKVNPLKAPKVPRAKEALEQVSFVLYECGYTITLHTSYLPAKKDFAKRGSIWIIITKTARKNGKRHYVSSFYRVGDFVNNVRSELQFLVQSLRIDRPSSHGNLADIERDAKNGDYWWVIRNKEKRVIHRSQFYQNIEPSVARNVIERLRQKKYYHQVGRKKKGVKQSIRKKRKQWAPYKYRDMP